MAPQHTYFAFRNPLSHAQWVAYLFSLRELWNLSTLTPFSGEYMRVVECRVIDVDGLCNRPAHPVDTLNILPKVKPIGYCISRADWHVLMVVHS